MGTQHVGPIIFADRTARAQLLHHGEVVTFRKRDRTTGDTWWRKSRTGNKKGDVFVEAIASEVAPVPDSLAPYREKSGFETVEDWIDAIGSVNSETPESGHLYRATAKSGTCEQCEEAKPLPTNQFCPACSRDEALEEYAQTEPY